MKTTIYVYPGQEAGLHVTGRPALHFEGNVVIEVYKKEPVDMMTDPIFQSKREVILPSGARMTVHLSIEGKTNIHEVAEALQQVIGREPDWL